MMGPNYPSKGKYPSLAKRPVPFLAQNAYQAFLRLHSGEKISYQEVKAFLEVTDFSLTGDEIEAVMRFSNTVLNTQREMRAKEQKFKAEAKNG